VALVLGISPSDDCQNVNIMTLITGTSRDLDRMGTSEI